MALQLSNLQNPSRTQWRDCSLCNLRQRLYRRALCPECHQALQVLKACGAVDYFCQHGHGLISKKRVEFIIA